MAKNKKILTAVQRYAINRAVQRVKKAREEFDDLLKEIAKEQGINLRDPKEIWRLSEDNIFLIREGKKNDS